MSFRYDLFILLKPLEVTLFFIQLTAHALAIAAASFFAIKSKKDIAESATLVVTPKSFYKFTFSIIAA